MSLKSMLSRVSHWFGRASRRAKPGHRRFYSARLDHLPVPKLRASSQEVSVALPLGSQAKFPSLLDLASGAPSQDTPEVLRRAACRAVESGENQYGQSNGDLPLRRLYAASRGSSQSMSQSAMAENEITVVAGTSAGLAAVLMSVLDAGDEVLVFEPYFEGYLQAVAMAQACTVPVPLSQGKGGDVWTIDETTLRAALTERSKVIIVNSPHNPTGRVFSASELAVVARVAREFDLLVVSDEVYGLITFNGQAHISMRDLPGMAERTVVIDGISKTHSASGWRVGLVLAPPAITSQLRRIVAALGLAAPTPLMVASRLAYDQSTLDGQALARQLQENRVQLQANAQVLEQALSQSGFHYRRPEGATYVFASLPTLKLEEGGDLASFLYASCGIKAAPGQSCFQGEQGRHWVRLCIARSTDVIAEAARRIVSIELPGKGL
ncbi:MAG: pyridoxal phosphate-dependent aminotransferase [Candidatus Obscuribacterales bacterium]|nr:pyridoxal phosphate-dependent aminotransferase [Candidatus Obscuribacterales bacterium]